VSCHITRADGLRYLASSCLAQQASTLLVEARETAPPMLADELRFEGLFAVPWYVHKDATGLGVHGLARVAIAGVGATPALTFSMTQ